MTPAEVAEIQAWLLTAGPLDDGGASLIVGLVERLRANSAPIWRCSTSLPTKHPELVWRTVQWSEAQGVTTIDRDRSLLDAAFFQASPVAALLGGAPPIRVPLVAGPLPYPICEDLRDQGGTEYLALPLPISTGDFSYVSWATQAPGGFGDDVVAGLAAIVPHLAARIELASAYHATRALLEVYLGRNAGRRVMAGGFRRGSGERISAAIWFCDLRGFTALSDSRTPDAVVAMLDAYFDAVAGAIMAAGGEVLKFIGDAILAIFPVDGDAAAACQRALTAVDAAFAALAPTQLAIGVGLHLGEVMYGNIGARDRLDFTVISSAVNEASRLEGLCKSLGTQLAMSDAFVAAAQPADARDLGPQSVKGVRAPLRVWTLPRYARD